MEPRNVAAWWIYMGSILIASAIVNTVINLNSTNFWNGLTVFEILLFGLIGVGPVAYGVTLYRRVSRAKIR
jgi:hypothetical protein